MKRKLAGLLTALMVLAMGTTAFAAGSGSPTSGSNSGTTSSKPAASGTTSSTPAPAPSQDPAIGNATNTTITQVSEAVADAAENVAKQVSPNAQVMAVVDVTYDGVIPAGGVQISFSLAGVQAGDNYVLLHQLADGRWEKITPDSIENGVIKATFTSLSPVAFVKIASPAPGTNDTGNGANNGTTTKPGTTTSTSNTAAGTVAASPKTGAPLPVLPVLAMICAAGIVVCGRKVKFND